LDIEVISNKSIQTTFEFNFSKSIVCIDKQEN
jgi:hypothetical protein